MRFVDLDFYFVEDTFGPHEEVSRGRIATPDNSGSTVDLHRQGATIHEPVQHGKIAREDGVFGVFDVSVFHTVSMARNQAEHKGVCAT